MAVKKLRQIEDSVYDSIPEYVKDSFDSQTIKRFASDILNSKESKPPLPGEWTTAGNQRITGPVSPFNGNIGLGFYRSSDIPLTVLDMMRRDSQVALGMAIVKFPITQLSYTINCDSPVIKTFIIKNLENKWADLVRNSLKSLDFGFIGFEKVWDRKRMDLDPGKNLRKIKDRNFIVLDKVKPIHPMTLTVRVDDKGNFAGINQDRTGVKKALLPRNKSMIITNDEEFGNFFGRSRMISSYEAWYWKQISTQFFLRYTERFSIPPYKVYYPHGIERFPNGQQIDRSEIAMKMANSVSSYGNIVIPSIRDKDTGHLLWDLESIDQGKLNIKPQDIVGFWDLLILRGLLIPDKATLSAMDEETGSQVYLSTLAAIVKQIEVKVNTEIIKPLVEWNFSKEERADCRLNIDDIDFKKRSEMRKLMSKILDLSSTYVKNLHAFPFKKFPDISKILDTLDVPQQEANVYVPKKFDMDGKELKDEEVELPKKTTGPDKGEKTSGNKAREGKDGDPKDDDKIDAKVTS